MARGRGKPASPAPGGRVNAAIRRRLGVLAERNFRRFYIGYTSSLLGTSMSAVAVAFGVLDSGGTATDLGIVLAANIVPMIAFLLGGGVIADRLGRRPVMLTADVARCAAQGTLAAALFTGRPQLWLFVAIALIVGTGNAFFMPALAGLTVQIAPRDQLGNANALFGMAQPGAQVAGPALAGILISAVSPAAVIAVDAASYAVSAVALSLLRFPARGRVPAPSLLRQLAEGWAEFTSRTWLCAGTVQFALFNLITWGPFLVLGPVLARQYLGGARPWGAVMACYGAGAILGGLLALGRRPARPMAFATVATLGFPLPPLALALHAPVIAVAAAALLAGLGSALGGAFETTVMQQQVPEDALARVGAFQMVGAFAFGPIAFAAAGPVAAAVGARALLGFGSAWAAAGTLVVLALPAVRLVTWLDTPAAGRTAPAAGRTASAAGRTASAAGRTASAAGRTASAAGPSGPAPTAPVTRPRARATSAPAGPSPDVVVVATTTKECGGCDNDHKRQPAPGPVGGAGASGNAAGPGAPRAGPGSDRYGGTDGSGRRDGTGGPVSPGGTGMPPS